MNVFRLSNDPAAAAQYLEDGHVNSQLHEAALMMSSELRGAGMDDDYLYGRAHPHHPSTKWVGEGKQNFAWMYDFCEAIYAEKCKRWEDGHASWQETVKLMPREPECLPDGETIMPVVGTPNDYIEADLRPPTQQDAVEAYRKAYFDTDRQYDLGTPRPEWAPSKQVVADD